MDIWSLLKGTWHIWLTVTAFLIHIEVKVARIENDVKWLKNNNVQKGGDD